MRSVSKNLRSKAASVGGLFHIQPPPSISSRSRFIVNSMFCDCRWRQLSTSVWYRSFGKRWKYSAANFLAAVRSRVNFSRTNGSWGHRVIKKLPQHGGELRPLGLLGCAESGRNWHTLTMGSPCRSFQKRTHPNRGAEAVLRARLHQSTNGNIRQFDN